MKTISVSISDLEYDPFGINSDRLSFTEFVDIIDKEITKQTLNKCIQLADKYKISRMSMDEITDEVKSVRNAKKIIDTNVLVFALIQRNYPNFILFDYVFENHVEIGNYK